MRSLILFTFLAVALALVHAWAANGPKCTQDEHWEFVVNNAYRIADKYAINREPRATFISMKNNYQMNEQVAGDYKGKYLLMLTNEHGGNISFAVLLPLFDVNQPSRGLDDNQPLWRVVNAKYNGREF